MGKLKGLIYIIQLVLWAAFACAVLDPGMLGARPAESLFSAWANGVDILYQIADVLTAPVQGLLSLFGVVVDSDAAGWFPLATAEEMRQLLASVGGDKLITSETFPGVLVWWIPLASGLYAGLLTALGYVYEPLRNWIWNIVIEYLFQQKKAKIYAQALDQRNADLARLNNQYRALARETHTLKDSVITDELTKVFNKRFFLSRLQQEFEVCKKQKCLFTVMMIDIDYFKRLNDTYGHLAGDKVLQAVAEVLKRESPGQCFPCRYGGEEFSVIMPNKGPEEAIELARSLQENVQGLRFNAIDENLRVTISQGICSVDFSMPVAKNLVQFDSVLELADQELYRSKMEGRNRFSINRLTQSQPTSE